MIHQKRFDSITGLASWVPELNYGPGDILFAYIDRSFLFDYTGCGIFRLKDNFSTSGETHDGILIIESLALQDMYWERVYKGKMKYFDSPITTCAQSGSVTVTHDADVNNERIVCPYIVNSAGGTGAYIDVSVGFSNVTISPVSGNDIYCVTVDDATDELSLSGLELELIIDQHVSLPATYDGFISTSLNWFDVGLDQWVFEVYDSDGTYTPGRKFYYLEESGGIWSVSARKLDGLSGYNSSQKTFNGNECAISSGGGSYPSINYTAIYNYSSQNDSWSLAGTLNFPEEYYGTGKGCLQFHSNGDLVTTQDEPPFLTSYYFTNFYSYPQRCVIYSQWSENGTTGEYYRWNRAHRGYSKVWPWAKDTLITFTTRTDLDEPNSLCRVQTEGGGLYDYEDIYSFTDNTALSGHGRMNLRVSFHNRLAGYDLEYKRWYVTHSNTKTGEVVDMDPDWPGGFPYYYYLGTQSPYTACTIGYTWDQTGAQSILTEMIGDFVADYDRVYYQPDNGTYDFYQVGNPNTIKINTSAWYDPTANAGSTIYAVPVNSTQGLFINIGSNGSEKWMIGHFQMSFGDYKSAYLLKAANACITAALTISTPTIDSTDVNNGICRFAMVDGANNIYKWSGTAWVSCTFLTANTKTEFLASNFTQAITDIGDNLGVCVVLHTDGVDTPIFKSISFSYTRPGRWEIQESLIADEANNRIEIVSSTQTKYTNLEATSKDIVLRVGLME